MARKTKKEFLENYSRNPQLASAVLRQMGMPWSEIIQRPMDFRDASAGVSGFIYYSETEKFAKRHIEEILELVQEYENDTGCPVNMGDNKLNFLAWFALESTIQDIIDYRDNFDGK